MIKYLSVLFTLMFSNILLKAQLQQLAPPIFSVQRAFIEQNTALSIDFRYKNAVIRYTTDGTPPHSNSIAYKSPIQIKKATVINAKAFHNDFESSESVTAQFYLKPLIPLTVSGTPPHPDYSAINFETLTDRKLGDSNFKKNYLGYNTDQISLDIQLPGNKTFNTLFVSVLVNQGSWIFSPSKIEIVSDGQVLQSIILNKATISVSSGNIVIPVSMKNNTNLTNLQNFKMNIYPVSSLPEWHGGAGNRAWVFVDEIWVE